MVSDVTSSSRAAPACLGKRLDFSHGDTRRFFKASFRLRVVVAQTIGAAQVQVDAGIGGVQAGGGKRGSPALELQRLGTDLGKPVEVAPDAVKTAATPAAAGPDAQGSMGAVR